MGSSGGGRGSTPPAVDAGGVLPRRGTAALVAEAGPAAQAGQGSTQQLDLGHVAEAVDGPGHAAGDLGVDRTVADVPLDQALEPAGDLAVERVQRLAPQMLRQGVAEVDHASDPAG